MKSERFHLTGVKRRMPDLVLETDGGEPAALLHPTRSVALILVDDVTCAACRSYLQALSSEADEFKTWDCDVVGVISGAHPKTTSPNLPWPHLLYDPEGRVQTATGVSSPAVIVVDQWGDITDVQEAGSAHAFPTTAELISWVRYLAIQCPECEGEAL